MSDLVKMYDKISYAVICDKFPSPHVYFNTYDEAEHWARFNQPNYRPYYITERTEHFEIVGEVRRSDDVSQHRPSAQPERDKVKWIRESLVTNYPYKCSVCKKYSRAMYDFCPNCGTDMRGDENG